VGVSVCDIAAGMTAYQAVLQALIGRGITGQGRHLSISLFHALTDWMNVPYLQYVYGGKEPVRGGLNHPTIAPYGAYTGSDGKDVLFSIQNEREWRSFCADILGLPDLPNDPRFDTNSHRVANRAVLDEVLRPIFAQVPRDEMVERLQGARIAYGRVSTMDDLAKHPQNRFVEVGSPTGPVRMLAPGVVVNGGVPDLGDVPSLGQHTDEVRAEFAEACLASA
jgi:crotonobetainyl-CoA:carnitine CoA-transferase CaiB-like acyl-CoA transferase